MNVLICLQQEDMSDNEYAEALKKHFGEDSEHYHLLLTRTALPADTDVDFSDFFEKLQSGTSRSGRDEDGEDEINGSLMFNEDYFPEYNPLTDQLIYYVVLDKEFNIPVDVFVKWIKVAWKTTYKGLVHSN